MESLLEPELNEVINKSGSVYVISEDGESIMSTLEYNLFVAQKADQLIEFPI